MAPVIVAGAYALTTNDFHWALFLLIALGVACLQMGSNTINDYYDDPGTDYDHHHYAGTDHHDNAGTDHDQQQHNHHDNAASRGMPNGTGDQL